MRGNHFCEMLKFFVPNVIVVVVLGWFFFFLNAQNHVFPRKQGAKKTVINELMSCHLYRVTSGQPNSVISKDTLQNLSLYKPFPKPANKTNLYKNIKKHTYTDVKHTFLKS